MRTIMHIDVNSAFLSWEAVYRLQKGENVDLREIPSVVGGNQADRKGIVLAKSTPAKQFGVITGEVLWQARQKCPNLVCVPPDYNLYMKASNALFTMLKEHFPIVQRFSIDECFCDFTGMENNFGEPVPYAYSLKDKVRKEFGFTVNIGIGHNKLLAKVAGDLKKPDMVHTLLSQEEIKKKMWPLPVRDLFMVGRASERKLLDIGIYTVGDLAKSDPAILKHKLKSHGFLIWQYANGIDESPVHSGYFLNMKGIGNSTTLRQDVTDNQTAFKVLLSLTETVCMRLRSAGACCSVISIEFRTSELAFYSHQRKIRPPTNITDEIYEIVKELFVEGWKGERIRHLGVRVTDLSADDFIQPTLLDKRDKSKKQALDSAIDSLRNKYGNNIVMRATFADKSYNPMTGGQGAEDYPVMSSIL